MHDHLRDLLPPRQADLLAGMVLGDKGLIPEDLHDDFKQSGLYHLLVVSGANIGFLLATMTMLISPFSLSLRLRRLIGLISIWGYVFLTDLNPATVRAAIMISLFLLSFEFRRIPRRWNLWGAAAAMILLLAPHQLFQPGFQLSFAAMAGVLFAADIHERKELAQPPLPLKSRRLWRFLRRYLVLPTLVSLSAVCFTAPILIWHFGGYAPIAILLNLLAIPLSGAIFSLTWLLLFMKVLFGFSAVLLAGGLEVALKGLEWLAVTGAALPGSAAGSYGSAWLALGIAAILGGFFHWRSASRRILWLLGSLAFLFLISFSSRQNYFQIEFLDVGQGDATLLRFPGGQTMLVDCGGEEAARFEIVPSLRRRGIHRIQTLVITQFDRDHAGGFFEISKNLRVDRILVNTLEPEEELGRSIISTAEASGIPVQSLAAGDTISGFAGARCLVLWPPRGKLDEDNASSIVLRVSYGACDILLTGDIGAPQEAVLAAAGDYLKSEILKVPHHGSARSSSPLLLGSARPQFAIICCGAKNPYGHPSERSLKALVEVGSHIHRTDIDHAAIWRSDGETIWPIKWQ
jgi:competence protein ComEC